jgi:hypothetical protein
LRDSQETSLPYRYFLDNNNNNNNKSIIIIMSEEEKKPPAADEEVAEAAEAAEEEEEEDEEDLEKLQAEIARMEAEAARITKETEDLEKKKGTKSSSTAGDGKAAGDAASRDGYVRVCVCVVRYVVLWCVRWLLSIALIYYILALYCLTSSSSLLSHSFD